jgi:hypothetical protein
MSGKDCLGSLTNRGSLEEGFGEFTKVFKFRAPNETGEYRIQVQATVNTSAGQTLTSTSDAFISVQNIITFTETKDQFDNWRFDFGPGQRVKIEAFAYGGNWSQKTISSVQVVEIRDKDWNDINSTINTTVSGCVVEFDAPTTSGFYQMKLLITTSEGERGYAAGNFMVRLYNIFVDTLDGSSDSATWQWKYGSTDAIYFRFNVLDMNGNRISASNLKIELDAVVNEITQKRYTGLTVTDLAADSIGRLGLMLNLSSTNLTAGPYHAEFKVRDTDGNSEFAGMWFKISNLNVWIDTKSTQGEWKWRFGPTDNITFTVNAFYFNGTQVPDGTTAAVEGLFMMKEGPPIKASSELYTSNATNLTGGAGTTWVKAAQGKTLPQGFFMASIKVTLPDGTIESQDTWFEVSLLDVSAYADPWSFSPSDNANIVVSVKKADGTAVESATVSLYKLRNSNTWTEVTLPSCSDVNTSSDGAATLTFPATGLNGNYEAELKVTSESLGATSMANAWFEVKQYKITGWPVDASKDTYQPGETVEMWVKVEYPNSTWQSPQYISGANVSVYKFANTEGWPWRYVETVSMVQAGITDSQGTCKIKFKAPSDAGRYNPMVQLNVGGAGYNSTSAWEVNSFNVRSAEVRVTLYDNSSGQLISSDKFSAGANVTVEINVSNPAGGEVNVSSIALKYKSISSDSFTNLQTLTYGLGSNNYATFSAPSTEGDYVVYVTVTDGSSGRALPSEKRWFKVQSFEVRFWLNQWSCSPAENVTVNFDAISPGGSPANFTVELYELKDVWTWSNVTPDYDDGPTNISGTGAYTFSAPPNFGEYEAVFCSYAQGSQCSADSPMYRMHFAVETFRINTWPSSASYTSDENVELNVELQYANGSLIPPSTYNATFTELRDMMAWQDATSSITVPNSSDSGNRKTFTFNASNLTVGDYVTRVNVTTSSESRVRDIWFKISDAQITVVTVPQQDGRNRERWFTGENITLSVTISPAQDATGTMKLMDDYGWREVASYSFNLTAGTGTITFTINESSRYSAIIKVGTAEAYYWFEAGAYQIIMKDWLSSHEIRSSENVSVVFDVQLPNGSQYSGDVNISVVSLRNPWDWSSVSGTDDMFSTTVTAGDGNEVFNFSHNQTSGEFDCELEFQIEDKFTHMGFWFMIKENMVDARSRQRTYSPGDNAYIDVWVGYPNMTAIQGANVSILSVKNKRDWSDVSVSYLAQYNQTDANGNTYVYFTLPTDKTGTFEVKLNVSTSESSQIAFTEVVASGYDAWFEMSSGVWSYRPGQTLNGTLYVYSSKVPVNASFNLKVKDDNWNNVAGAELDNYTGSDGIYEVSLDLNASVFTPGHYSLYMDIGSGAAIVRDIWFKVETFNTKLDIMKEDSSGNLVHSDNFVPNDTIVIKVEVLDALGSLVQSQVNSSLLEVRSIPWWDDATGNFTNIADTLPPTNGITRVKLRPGNGTSGEFNVRVNVTANVSGVVASNTVDAWIMIRDFEISLSFSCPTGSSSYCDPRRAASGSTMEVNVSVSGSYNSLQVCMERIRNIYTGYETSYGSQYCITNTSNLLTFTAPTSEGEYDAIFTMTVNGQRMNDRGEYFRVGGSYDINTWVESGSVYAGNNATMWVEIWGPGWTDVNESECNLSITEMRSARTWQVISTNVTYTVLGPEERINQPGSRIEFTVPSHLTPGDYMAKAKAVCGNSTMTGDGWFRVVIFQVASLLDSQLKSNQSATLWLKAMNGSSGAPLSNATVRFDKLIDDWSWTTVTTYNTQSTTDTNGEVLFGFTAPANPGHYLIKATVTYSDQSQEVDRAFDIRALDIKITTPQDTFFLVNNQTTVIVDVNVTDPLNSSAPVSGASVNLNLWAFMEEGEGEGPEQLEEGGGNPGGPSGFQEFTAQSNASGIARFEITSAEFNFSSGDYEAHVNVNTPEYGWGGSTMKTIMVRRYNVTLSGLTSEYNAGDTVSFNVTVKEQNGTAVQSKLVLAIMESMEFKVGGNQTSLNSTGGMTGANGTASFSMAIPSNASAGPTFMIIQVKEGGAASSTENEEEYFFLLHGIGGISLSFTNLNSSDTILPGSFIDVNVSCSNTSLALAPFMMHLEKTGGAVPMSQLMAGGPDSGKETTYESSIFLDPNQATHIKALVQKQPGTYMILQPLIQKNAGSTGHENFEEMGMMEYTVS